MGVIGRILGGAASLLVASLASTAMASAAPVLPRFDHVVIVVMENKNYNAIIGRPDEAPYINKLAAAGATFSNSFAIGHPSQPNYLALFSGSTQGVTSDHCPENFTNVPNLGAELIGAGLSFAGFSESMPSAGYTGRCSELSLGYTRVHNPWVDFSNVPATSNLTFAEFPKDYAKLPTVSFVIPNLCHDMHYCSRDSGDRWIRYNLGAYASWARTHNSLLIITWDEDGTILGVGGDNNKIPTIFYGAHVRRGTYAQRINNYSVLATIEDMYGLPRAARTAHATAITDTWR
jgi:phosphatidylinositol-3-phosphatase